MKSIIVTGFAVAALTTSAFAQTAAPPPAPPAPPAAQGTMTPPPPHSAVPEVMNDAANPPPPPMPGRDAPPPMAGRDAPPPPPPGPRDGAMRGPGPQDDAMRWHHRGPPPSKAAHFRIEDGRTKIDVKCAEDEPTKVCADTLMQIIDKLSGSTDRSDDDDRY